LKLIAAQLRRRSAGAACAGNPSEDEGYAAPYLVRMIKPKPDPFSRLARSTNLSKIL